MIGKAARQFIDQPDLFIRRLEQHCTSVGTGIRKIKPGSQRAIKKLWKENTVCRSLGGHQKGLRGVRKVALAPTF